MLGDFLNTIYPNNCIACSEVLFKQEEYICTKCLVDLPETSFEATTKNPASKLLTGRTHFNTCIPLYYYQRGGKVQKILQSMKYKGGSNLCQHMGKKMGVKISKYDSLGNIDAIIPVPLHAKKLKKRGYNQSEHLAIGMEQILDVPVSTKELVRVSNNATQTNKSREERWQNVNEIFTLVSPDAFRNKHVLLVDDVVTTGSTIEACCNALNESENITISIATLATA